MCRIQFEGLLCPECQWEGEDGRLSWWAIQDLNL